ncbi:MAG: DUF1735 domain-containing protein [Bacteroidales bacterium]|nr:DUF1735 domain-containing protein [Bacteroidales bacterium]
MKRFIIVPIVLALLMSSCDSSDDIWLDNDVPKIYLPQPGVSFNTAWKLDTEEYLINFGLYLSGIRPENQKTNVEVTFSIKSSLIADYNSDPSQQYTGQVQELPANCYEISGTKATIPSGNNSGYIPIKVYTEMVDALPKVDGGGNAILYAIPIYLESVSKYEFSEDQTRREALCVIQLDNPRFYFWVNRNGLNAIGRRMLYGATPIVENFQVTSYGLTNDQAYSLTFAVDPAAVPPGGQILPADAYELPSTTVEIPSGKFNANFPIKIINNNIAFRETFYLPVAITSTSKYSADSEKGILLLKVEVKNDYEWSYSSQITSLLTETGRADNYSATKAPTSHDAETVRIQLSTNSTNAGSSFNNKYYRLKVIPNPANNRKWGVEIIQITDEGSANSPTTLELNPNYESYYDWDYETFYLYYRWKNSGGFWIEVSEILAAQF